MAVVKINAIEVPEGAGPELEKRFANRLHAVDGQPGKKVADALGLTVAAVYLARSRVLARLKELVRSAQEP